jgi:hypothetical protein
MTGQRSDHQVHENEQVKLLIRMGRVGGVAQKQKKTKKKQKKNKKKKQKPIKLLQMISAREEKGNAERLRSI